MEAELENYQFQLSQVAIALEADPSNSELTSLKAELEEIIALTKQALGIDAGASATPAPAKAAAAPVAKDKGKAKETVAASASPVAASSPAPAPAAVKGESKAFRAGDEVSAKYKDGKWYPARVTVVAGAVDSPVYTVIFKGYTTPQTLAPNSIRAVSATTSSHSSTLASSSDAPMLGQKRKLTKEEEEREREKRKKKSEKWTENMNNKAKETMNKKSAWESFGKKAAKKGVKIQGLQGKSIFRTPDNATGKVGVVGSGRGVTEYETRGKHKFGGAGGAGDE